MSNSAEIIGKARRRGWRHDQGTHGQAACKYKIYLFDVKMNQGKQFNDVRAVSYFSGSDAGVGFADIVLDEEGRAIDEEGEYEVEQSPFLDDEGSPIVLESEKASMEIPSEDKGIIKKVFVSCTEKATMV